MNYLVFKLPNIVSNLHLQYLCVIAGRRSRKDEGVIGLSSTPDTPGCSPSEKDE